MIKISKIVYLIVAAITPILIGTLHIITHFTQLTNPEIYYFLQEEFIILGKPQSLWYTWGIVSFMMGAAFIIIGLLNMSMLNKLKANECIPFLSLIAMLLYQMCVTYVGYEYTQNFQFYGGLFGLALLIACVIFTVRAVKNS